MTIIGVFLLGAIMVILGGLEVGVIHHVKPAGRKLLIWCGAIGGVLLILGASWQVILSMVAAILIVGLLMVLLHFSSKYSRS
ncbi:hypothetical protein [Schleiferilactobacillus perolens]|jgi:hypothetical protein|uniref:hypothetical protein n=1 Tax=Schleiferilactobacillus perolens TaxID=100468 RepID=UPI0023576251|nr:hypothetical protein [Schleiferilactobacillus perolens]MCI1892809.1 hypothetical protein [Schleiferilactobacillus harbinensis]MCI1913778.1 hypothetical protein [Schleiferilactobacillus harbinensis]MCI2170819.1 hypothetical protein [Schleiferilactobacillus perolens]